MKVVSRLNTYARAGLCARTQSCLLPLVLAWAITLLSASAQKPYWQSSFRTGPVSLTIAPNGTLFVLDTSGVHRSTDRGISWTKTKSVKWPFLTGEIAARGDGVVFDARRDSLWHSHDNGTTWSGTDWGGFGPINVRAVAFNSLGHIFVGACFAGVIRSTDNGMTWERCLDADVHALRIGPQDQIFAGEVYRSTDGGGAWINVDGPIAAYHVTSFAFGPDGEVFVGTGEDRYIMVEYPFHGVYRSTDSGNGWVAVNDGLEVMCVQSLAFYSHGILFAAGDMGWGGRVFRSTNLGNSWSDVTMGLEGGNVWVLAIDQAGYVYATTNRGVFRSISPGVVSVSEPAPDIAHHYCLRQNYPNPFNLNSEIRYQISEFRIVKLSVYDLLGREISVLVNEKKAPGSYSVTFDGSGLSSGVYFYRLTAEDFVATKRLLLLK